jgi:hypothetical protein
MVRKMFWAAIVRPTKLVTMWLVSPENQLQSPLDERTNRWSSPTALDLVSPLVPRNEPERARRHREAGERHVPVGMDRVGQLLLALGIVALTLAPPALGERRYRVRRFRSRASGERSSFGPCRLAPSVAR